MSTAEQPDGPQTKKAHLMMVGARDAGSIHGADFYATPPCATEALLTVEAFQSPIWEPACGDGAISKVLEMADHHVVSTDLNHHGYGMPGVDFLLERRLLAPNVVTNPPFKLANEFVLHAAELGAAKIAVLCRLQWLEGTHRRKMFQAVGLSRVWVFSRRLPRMHRYGYTGKTTTSTIAFAWFVFDNDIEPTATTKLGWL